MSVSRDTGVLRKTDVTHLHVTPSAAECRAAYVVKSLCVMVRTGVSCVMTFDTVSLSIASVSRSTIERHADDVLRQDRP